MKKSAFDGLSKTTLLKQSWKHEEEVTNADLDDEDEQGRSQEFLFGGAKLQH